MAENGTVQTTGGTENNNINLSEMDKIFIPDDLDNNIEMLNLLAFRYNAKGFQVVPERYSLVKKNIFTQKNKNVKGFGVKFFAPLFTKTILVPKQNGVKKFSVTSLTANDEEITVDIDVVMKITDPAKYIVEGKNKINELTARVNDLLRTYIKYETYETISKVRECTLSDFDPTSQFVNFERDYGISVEKVILEKIELAENLRKVFDDRTEALKRRDAELINLELSKEKAKTQAENIRMIADAENYKLKSQGEIANEILKAKVDEMIRRMHENGATNEEINKTISTILLTDSKVGEKVSDAAIAGMAAAQVLENARGQR